jgi:hypothetical protein
VFGLTRLVDDIGPECKLQKICVFHLTRPAGIGLRPDVNSITWFPAERFTSCLGYEQSTIVHCGAHRVGFVLLAGISRGIVIPHVFPALLANSLWFFRVRITGK